MKAGGLMEHQKKHKIKRSHLIGIIIFLSLIVLGAVIYVGLDLYQENRGQRDQAVYQQGLQIGQRQALEQIIRTAQQSGSVSLTIPLEGNETAQANLVLASQAGDFNSGVEQGQQQLVEGMLQQLNSQGYVQMNIPTQSGEPTMLALAPMDEVPVSDNSMQ